MLHTKRCKHCTIKIIGRPDKQFCSAICKSKFHNQKNYGNIRNIKHINTILKKNYAILLDLMRNSNTNLITSVAMPVGFKSEYTTQISITSNGELCYYCYDIQYRINKQHICIHFSPPGNQKATDIHQSLK